MAAIDDYMQAKDRWELSAPARHAAAVVPSDTVDLAHVTRALVIGVAGDVKVDMAGGEAAVTLPLPAGVIPIRVTRVYATGTTATGLVALW